MGPTEKTGLSRQAHLWPGEPYTAGAGLNVHFDVPTMGGR